MRAWYLALLFLSLAATVHAQDESELDMEPNDAEYEAEEVDDDPDTMEEEDIGEPEQVEAEYADEEEEAEEEPQLVESSVLTGEDKVEETVEGTEEGQESGFDEEDRPADETVDLDMQEDEDYETELPALPEVVLQPASKQVGDRIATVDLLLASNAADAAFQAYSEILAISAITGLKIGDIYIMGPSEPFKASGIFRLSAYPQAGDFKFVDQVPEIFLKVASSPAMAAYTKEGAYLVEGETRLSKFFTSRGDFIEPAPMQR